MRFLTLAGRKTDKPSPMGVHGSRAGGGARCRLGLRAERGRGRAKPVAPHPRRRTWDPFRRADEYRSGVRVVPTRAGPARRHPLCPETHIEAGCGGDRTDGGPPRHRMRVGRLRRLARRGEYRSLSHRLTKRWDRGATSSGPLPLPGGGVLVTDTPPMPRTRSTTPTAQAPGASYATVTTWVTAMCDIDAGAPRLPEPDSYRRAFSQPSRRASRHAPPDLPTPPDAGPAPGSRRPCCPSLRQRLPGSRLRHNCRCPCTKRCASLVHCHLGRRA
ncbi:hypothetical protein EHYA_07667 [Embleya hyalina]|uniref:Uncharacterized protein n=1 Tax=Embleya hyalina TaxID=516124 RepID=A0A401YZC5_9ACTN|nr:hypothetical protein EHYA_07667 [Embleya hyalina]